MPYKGELQNNMRDVVVVVSTLVSFLCWKKCFLGELRLNCALFFGFFLRKKKKKKTERVDLEKCRRQAVLIITSSYTRLRMTQWTHLNTLNVPGISKYLSHAERRSENNASIYFTGWVGWWGGEKCTELPLPSPLTHIWHERDKGIT